MEAEMIVIVAMLYCAIEDKEGQPLIYRDKDTSLLVVVESNRQKVMCLKPDGELLWHKDLAEYIRGKERESPAERMRKADLQVVPIRIHALYNLQPPRRGCVGLAYRSSFKQGVHSALDLKTGELHLIGAD
jgi:hypothetical protein